MATCVGNSCPKTTITHLSKLDYFSLPSFQEILLCSSAEEPSASASAADDVWSTIRSEARQDAEREPVLRKYYHDSILSHSSLESALANLLANKLAAGAAVKLADVFREVLDTSPEIRCAVRADLRAAHERDPACTGMVHCMLYYKGFLACQAHRVAHRLWRQGRAALALFIQSRVSEAFGVDIHPGAHMGRGIHLDHATGLVIGETAVVGDNVSLLHNVTLGGTGKASGDRHPKIGDGVLIGAGTQILGNVSIGEGAKIGAGSVVLNAVPARATAVGNPARLVRGRVENVAPPGITMDHTSWSDYVI